MASNAELIEKANELAKKFGAEITTDGLNNKELSALVKDLNAKLSDAETVTQLDDEPGTPSTEPKPAPKGLRVAEGKSVTSIRGLLGEDEPVSAKDFTGGDKSIEHLLKAGILVK